MYQNNIGYGNNSISYNVLSGWFKELEKAQGANSTNNALEQETKRMMAYLQNMQSTFQGALGGSSGTKIAGQVGDNAYGLAQDKKWQGKSNLSHSPEVVLALNDIMKKRKGFKFEKLPKELEKYGIKAEYKDIKTVNSYGKDVTRKGIVLGNSDF